MRSLIFALFVCAPSMWAQTADLSGNWMGTLNAGGTELRLALHLKRDPAGVYTGTMDSLDQGANGIPLGKIAFEANELTIEVPAVRGQYKGTLAAEGKELKGQWTQAGELPLTFRRVEKMPDLSKPQEPKKPYPYDEVEVSYANEAGKVKLAGTMTIPRTGNPAAAVLLITGSGPQDRNETLMGHKPFLVLADYLTRRGLVVLRVDDRGVGGSSGNVMQSTSVEFAGDALAGIAFLKTRSEVDPKRIGLIGHSEGGVIAPIVASQSKDVAFIVLMAGTGVRGEEILYEQAKAIMKASGGSDEAVEKNRGQQKQIFEIIRTVQDATERADKIKEITGRAPGMESTRWFRAFLDLNPAEYLKKVECPVLAINGELDTQVVHTQNLPAIEAALKEGGNKDYTMRKLAGLNHLFQTAKTGAPVEYGRIQETIAPAALEVMGDWLQKHTQVKGN